MEIYPVKGTHDLYDEEANLYREIENRCIYLASLFNFNEIRTPILEHTNLFVRGVGESSDIVNKEMYTFEDKGGRSVTLRPELTAGIMRSVVTNKLYANADLPLRYFYLGPCFRYERPQAGRYRQFSQFGLEAIGAPSYLLDAEIISLGYRILYLLDIPNVKVYINSLGDEQSRANYRAALKEYFAKHIDNMCADCKRRYEVNPLRILDCKVEADQEIIKNAPKMSDYLSPESKLYLNNVVSLLKEIGIEVIQDDNLVRGLDYYTGVVFEYHVDKVEGLDNVGALGGGGHYAKLLKEIGGPDLEGVGLAFGIERLAYIFKHTTDQNFAYGPDVYLMGMNQEIIDKNFSLAEHLRSTGFVVEANYEVKSMKSLLKTAVKKNARFALIIGEDELLKNQVTIKNLKTQEQTSVGLEDLVRILGEMVNESRANEASINEEGE